MPELYRSVSNRELAEDNFSSSSSSIESIDYSFASEYNGPPPHHRIPEALPIDLDRIPTAIPAASSNSRLDDPLPVVQPVYEFTLGSTLDDSSLLTAALNLAGAGEHCHDDHHDHYAVGVMGGLVQAVSSLVFWSHQSVSHDDLQCALPKLPADGTESSGTLGFSDSHAHSGDLSGSSGTGDGGTPAYFQEGAGLDHNVGVHNFTSTEPALNPLVFSASAEEAFDDDDDDDNHNADADADGLQHHTRKSCVTFLVPESSEPVQQEAEPINRKDQVIRVIQRIPGVKKGHCHRCPKGNRLSEMEACISCDAKYCSNCILRAMGSMPEGRKCLGCIGCPVAAGKRRVLGKCSRVLHRLLSDDEITRIMNSELSCAANQLSPDQICVNARPLSLEELMLLQNSPWPPRNLKPGHYWYDRLSGLWGKKGHKPCQVITPLLNVGESMKRDASNGNTKILVNNREITKVELLGLQWAGIPCAGLSSLWLSDDGSCQEEGMKITKGNIWSTKRARLVCNILSLPTPNRCREQSSNTMDGVEPRAHCKFLLVGSDRSGASTIFKQARNVYNIPFSNEEREDIKFMIQRNLYGYLAVLLEGREQFEEECSSEMRKRQSTDQPGPSGAGCSDLAKNIYSIGPRLKTFSDWLIQITVSGDLDIIIPASTREYVQYVEELWKDQAIQATYSRRNELDLPRVASYFLDMAVEIASVDYEPSDIDILYADGITFSGGLAHMDFSFHVTPQDSLVEPVGKQEPIRARSYQLVSVPVKSFGENCKWLDLGMFEDFGIALFCVSLTEYDEYKVDNSGVLVNKMLSSKRLFERIVSHPSSRSKNFLLILNNMDLLEEKIERVPLSECEWFRDFNPVLSRHGHRNMNMPPLAQRAFHYVGAKFKWLFKELTGRKLYVCQLTALEPDAVDGALRYAREIIEWEERKVESCYELSSESIEASSFI
ncbi:Extra-large guanine nucleotide-binding protein 2 [Dionaea muscipula]